MTAMPYTRSTLASHFATLGLKAGDTVLVRAAARSIGPTDGRQAEVLIDALCDAVGAGGTLLGLAFSDSFLRFRRAGTRVYTPAAPVATGGFAAALLARPGAVRSGHPTNSFVALGARASEVLAGHDHTTSSFFPMKRLIDFGGRMLLVGCVESSPGFSTVHLAQEDLGLATRTFLSGMYGTYFELDGRVEWFSRRDVSGCSAGFWKFYAHYVAAEQLATGRVGDAYSALIDARAAYGIERALLERNPRFALCDRADCATCRGSRFYNRRDMPMYALRVLASGKLLRLFR